MSYITYRITHDPISDEEIDDILEDIFEDEQYSNSHHIGENAATKEYNMSEKTYTANDVANMLKSLQNLRGDYDGDPTLTYNKGTQTTIPAGETRTGKRPGVENMQIVKELVEFEESKKVITQMTRQYHAPVTAVQVAAQRVLRKVFGTEGKGVQQVSMFGVENPKMDDIVVGLKSDGTPVKESAMQPGSEYEVAALGDGAKVSIGGHLDENYGVLGAINVETPKRNQPVVNQFFELVEAELQTSNIYKGQPLKFFKNKRDDRVRGKYTLEHMHILPKEYLTYNSDVADLLDTHVMINIDSREKLQALGESTKFKVMFSGTPGNGKTEASIDIAGKARAKGVTTLFYSSSAQDTVEDLAAAFNMANLLAGKEGAILVIEDLDSYFTSASNIDPTMLEKQITEILDGGMSKSSNISVIMTSNHPEHISGKTLRLGRVDATIEFTKPDRDSFAKLVQLKLGDWLRPDTDLDEVFQIADGLAFSALDAVFSLARKLQIAKNRELDGIGTEELRKAARSAVNQQKMSEESADATRRVITMDSLVGEVVDAKLSEVRENISWLRDRFE